MSKNGQRAQAHHEEEACEIYIYIFQTIFNLTALIQNANKQYADLISNLPNIILAARLGDKFERHIKLQ